MWACFKTQAFMTGEWHYRKWWLSWGGNPQEHCSNTCQDLVPSHAVWIIFISMRLAWVQKSLQNQGAWSPRQHILTLHNSHWNAAIKWPTHAAHESHRSVMVQPSCGYSNSGSSNIQWLAESKLTTGRSSVRCGCLEVKLSFKTFKPLPHQCIY